MKALAQNHKVIRRSENPKKDFLYTPSIIKVKNERYLVSYDISDRTGYICASDDKGESWVVKAHRDFHHARLFMDGDRIYLIGHMNDIIVFYSDDNGDTWSEGSFLTEGEKWHQSACSVWYKDGYVYLVMETSYFLDSEEPFTYWQPNIIAPVVLRGKLGTDLSKRENWLFSERKRFRDVIKSESELQWFGVPFLKNCWEKENRVGTSYVPEYKSNYDYENDKPGMEFSTHPIGWLETNVVQITDPNHYWYDESGKTLHLFMRAHTAGSGYCCLMKAVERVRDGVEVIDIECETTPAGKKIVFLPMPGGQMKFYVKYDEVTKLYWLVSTQATDTMCRVEYLSDERYNLPCDERERLVLHYSKNMVDWCFAGLVAKGDSPRQSRHYASMDIDGDDLIIASRSGDEGALSAHSGNILTFHRIENFRELVY